MKARDAKPGDRLCVGAGVKTAPTLLVVVIEGAPSEPHLIRTNYGDFAEHVCEPIASSLHHAFSDDAECLLCGHAYGDYSETEGCYVEDCGCRKFVGITT